MADLSRSVQDYLKALYTLTRGGQATTTSALADLLGFAPASVTNMLQKMALMQPPLVLYQKRQSVKLSEAGERAALRILRRHRLLETFMVDILGYTWDEVHDEADQLEHTISARFEERLAKFLNHPEFDPHGDPIPDADLILPVRSICKLTGLRSNQAGKIRRVLTSDATLLRYFDEIGVRPGEVVRVAGRDPVDSVVQIAIGVGLEKQSLGKILAEMIEVEPEGE